MRYLLPVLSLLLIAGCARELTPQERADEYERYVESLIVKYGPACDRFHANASKEWGQCVVMLAEKDEAMSAARRAHMSRALRQIGNNYGAAAQRQPPTPVQCRWIGDVWTCN